MSPFSIPSRLLEEHSFAIFACIHPRLENLSETHVHIHTHIHKHGKRLGCSGTGATGSKMSTPIKSKITLELSNKKSTLLKDRPSVFQRLGTKKVGRSSSSSTQQAHQQQQYHSQDSGLNSGVSVCWRVYFPTLVSLMLPLSSSLHSFVGNFLSITDFCCCSRWSQNRKARKKS